MSNRRKLHEDRALELLADQAAFGLSVDERDELDALLTTMPGFDRDCMWPAAAIVLLAGASKEPEPLPELLQQRILAKVREFGTLSHRKEQPPLS